jgi:hypothetical protein
MMMPSYRVQQAIQPLPGLPSTWKILEGPLISTGAKGTTGSAIGGEESLAQLNCVEVLLYSKCMAYINDK